MENIKHILIVDDDADIRQLLSQFLCQHNFKVSLAGDGRDMQLKLQRNDIDLIVLDVMLPGASGTQLCQQLRRDTNIPIIMLTAVDEEVERILALEMGADDYLGKPFNPRELLARIKAVLRRTDVKAVDKNPEQAVCYQFDRWLLDTGKRHLMLDNDIEVMLSSGEYALLLAFVERPQRVLSRDLLLDITKNREAGPYDRSIDIQISRLRHKIEESPKKPQLLKTVRGGGYVLTTDVVKQ
jgi:two-component system, OmpR family, response regulator